jgi:hypothetical protein
LSCLSHRNLFFLQDALHSIRLFSWEMTCFSVFAACPCPTLAFPCCNNSFFVFSLTFYFIFARTEHSYFICLMVSHFLTLAPAPPNRNPHLLFWERPNALSISDYDILRFSFVPSFCSFLSSLLPLLSALGSFQFSFFPLHHSVASLSPPPFLYVLAISFSASKKLPLFVYFSGSASLKPYFPHSI